jgi:tryptophan synthase alpha chain
MRRFTGLPLAVGFGVSTAEQVAQVAAIADGVVVGSAIVKCIERHAGSADLDSQLERFIRELTAPLRGA